MPVDKPKRHFSIFQKFGLQQELIAQMLRELETGEKRGKAEDRWGKWNFLVLGVTPESSTYTSENKKKVIYHQHYSPIHYVIEKHFVICEDFIRSIGILRRSNTSNHFIAKASFFIFERFVGVRGITPHYF